MPSGIYFRTKKHRENLGKAMSKALIGKALTDEHCENIGKASRGRHWKMSEIGRKNISKAGKGKHHLISLKGRENITKSLIGRHYKWKSEKSKKRMQIVRLEYMLTHNGNFKDTDIEIIVEQRLRFLIRKNIISFYKKQVRFKSYLVDFYIPELKLIIECFGTYWHKGFAKKYKDIKRKRALEKMKNRVLILWEDEIKSKNFKLLKVLKERRLLKC